MPLLTGRIRKQANRFGGLYDFLEDCRFFTSSDRLGVRSSTLPESEGPHSRPRMWDGVVSSPSWFCSCPVPAVSSRKESRSLEEVFAPAGTPLLPGELARFIKIAGCEFHQAEGEVKPVQAQ